MSCQYFDYYHDMSLKTPQYGLSQFFLLLTISNYYCYYGASKFIILIILYAYCIIEIILLTQIVFLVHIQFYILQRIPILRI